MKNLRIYFIRFILFTIAFQILNLSVCGSEYMQQTVDDNGNTVLTQNQIDSFVEYVAEEVVAHKNIFPEHKGNHSKNNNKLVKAAYQIFVPFHPKKVLHSPFSSRSKMYADYKSPYFPRYYAEIFPKPPNTIV